MMKMTDMNPNYQKVDLWAGRYVTRQHIYNIDIMRV